MAESRITTRTWKAWKWGTAFYRNLKEKSNYEYHDFYSDLVREFLLIYRWVSNKEWKKLRIKKEWKFLPMRYNPEIIVSLMILKWFYRYSHPKKELTNKDLVMIWWLAFDEELQYAKTYKKAFPELKLGKLPTPYVKHFLIDDQRDYDPLDKNSFQKYTKYISRDFFRVCLENVLLHIQTDYGNTKRALMGQHILESYINKHIYFIIDSFKTFVNSLWLGKTYLAKNKPLERRQLKWKTDFQIIASTIDNLTWHSVAPTLEQRLEEAKQYYESNYENMSEEEKMCQKKHIDELGALSPDDLYEEILLWDVFDYLYLHNKPTVNKFLLWVMDINYIYIYQ